MRTVITFIWKGKDFKIQIYKHALPQLLSSVNSLMQAIKFLKNDSKFLSIFSNISNCTFHEQNFRRKIFLTSFILTKNSASPFQSFG